MHAAPIATDLPQAATSHRWRWSRRATWTTVVASTVLAAVYAAQTLALQSSEARPLSAAPIIVMSLAQWWLWGLCAPMVLAAAARWDVAQAPRARAVFAHLLIAPVLSFVQAAIIALLAYQLALRAEQVSYWPIFSGYAYSRLQGNLLVYGMLLLIAWGMAQTGAARERAIRTVALEGALAQAELEALRMQLNPHFLFNTLHAIRTLVDTDPTAARQMLVRLGDLLHATLDASATQETTLDDELAVLRGYLDIELTRFADRLRIQLDVPPTLGHAVVPSFALQPLAENAIRHGIAESVSGGTIHLIASTSGEQLVLVMRNDGATAHSERTKGHGVGHAATRARLQRLYGSAASLDFRREPGGRVAVELRIPLRWAPA